MARVLPVPGWVAQPASTTIDAATKAISLYLYIMRSLQNGSASKIAGEVLPGCDLLITFS